MTTEPLVSFRCGIGLLHVQIGGIQTGVNGQVKLIHGVIGDGHARGASLSVVDDGVDATELLNGLVDDVLDDSLVVLTSRNIGLNRQNLDTVLGLEDSLAASSLATLRPVMTRFAPSLAKAISMP